MLLNDPASKIPPKTDTDPPPSDGSLSVTRTASARPPPDEAAIVRRINLLTALQICLLLGGTTLYFVLRRHIAESAYAGIIDLLVAILIVYLLVTSWIHSLLGRMKGQKPKL